MLSAVLADVVHLAEPWRWFFFVGVFLMSSSLLFPVSRLGFTTLYGIIRSHEPPPPPLAPPDPAIAEAAAAERDAQAKAEERGIALRAALHSVLAELLRNRGLIYDSAQSGRYWPESLSLHETAWKNDGPRLSESQQSSSAYVASGAAYAECERVNHSAYQAFEHFNGLVSPDDKLMRAVDVCDTAMAQLRSSLAELV